MIDAPQVLTTTSQLTASIHLTIPRAEMRHVMGPGIGELMAVIAKQGVGLAGSCFVHHLRIEPDRFDFEISVPTATKIIPAGPVKPTERPAMTVARTIYHGPYEGLASAWSEFGAWMIANGHTPALDLYECYIVGPNINPDPASWRTELTRPFMG